MRRRTIRTIAGLTLAPLAFEVIPHGRDEACVPVADIVVRLCEPPERVLIGRQNTHVPHDHFETEPLTASLNALDSSSSTGGGPGVDPMTWQNSSMMDAANIAIRRHRASRDAQTRAALMYSMNDTIALASMSAGSDQL